MRIRHNSRETEKYVAGLYVRTYGKMNDTLPGKPFEGLPWLTENNGRFHLNVPMAEEALNGSISEDQLSALAQFGKTGEAIRTDLRRDRSYNQADDTLAQAAIPHRLVSETLIDGRYAYNDPRIGLRKAMRALMPKGNGMMSKKDVAEVWARARSLKYATVITPEEFRPIDEAARRVLQDDLVEDLNAVVEERLALSHASDLRDVKHLSKIYQEIIDEMSNDGDNDGDGDGDGEDGEDGGKGGNGSQKGDKGKNGSKSEDKPAEEDSGADGGDEDNEDEDDGRGSDYEVSDEDLDDHKVNETEEKTQQGGHGYGDSSNATARQDHADFEAALEDFSEKMEKPVPAGFKDTVPLSNPQRKLAEAVAASKKRGRDWTTIEPSQEVRRAVQALARRMERLNVPEIRKARVASQVPPGRIHGAEAMRHSANRSMGLISNAKPWRQNKKTHVLAPPTAVGILTDVSGSMSWAERAVAEAAYIFAHAGSKVGARTASSTFGYKSEINTIPGVLPEKVNIRASNGGYESIEGSFAMLDAALQLTTNRNATRILVVYSDNALVHAYHATASKMWLKILLDAGVHIIWANDDKIHGSAEMDKRVQQVRVSSSPAKLVDVVMEAIEKSVELNKSASYH